MQILHLFKEFQVLNKYYIALTNEITEAEADINDLKRSLSEITDPNHEVHTQKVEQLKGIEQEIESYENKSEEYEKNLQEVQVIIDELKNPIKQLFERVGCDDELLSKSYSVSGVNENNIMSIMGVIEQRVLEIAQMNALYDGGLLDEFVDKWNKSGQANKFDVEVNNENQARPFKGRQSMINPHPNPLKAPQVPSVNQIDEQAIDDQKVNIDQPLSIEEIKKSTETTITKLLEQQKRELEERRSVIITSNSNNRFSADSPIKKKYLHNVGTPHTPRTPHSPSSASGIKRHHSNENIEIHIKAPHDDETDTHIDEQTNLSTQPSVLTENQSQGIAVSPIHTD